jgi:hypothetical protein
LVRRVDAKRALLRFNLIRAPDNVGCLHPVNLIRFRLNQKVQFAVLKLVILDGAIKP